MIRRYSNQRQIVYDALNLLGHASSEELIDYFKQNNTDISLATIYRNINVLIDEAKVKKVKLQGIDVYETVKNKHYHFVCSRCNNIIDIAPDDVHLSPTFVSNVGGNKIDYCEVSFYGLCFNCVNKEKEGK